MKWDLFYFVFYWNLILLIIYVIIYMRWKKIIKNIDFGFNLNYFQKIKKYCCYFFIYFLNKFNLIYSFFSFSSLFNNDSIPFNLLSFSLLFKFFFKLS